MSVHARTYFVNVYTDGLGVRQPTRQMCDIFHSVYRRRVGVLKVTLR